MSAKKALICAVAATLACAALMTGCGEAGGGMQDGYYNAEMDGYSHGWKEFITICVRNNSIVSVEYGARDESGYIKAWDMGYMRTMNRVAGNYPNRYSRHYASQALEKQSGRIDVMTGATHSYHSFTALMDAVIEKAVAGDTSISIVQGGDE